MYSFHEPINIKLSTLFEEMMLYQITPTRSQSAIAFKVKFTVTLFDLEFVLKSGVLPRWSCWYSVSVINNFILMKIENDGKYCFSPEILNILMTINRLEIWRICAFL
jgi:hypothetical protein